MIKWFEKNYLFGKIQVVDFFQIINGAVALITELWHHSVSAMVWNAYHAPEIIMLHTFANFQKSTIWIFPNKLFFSNHLIMC